MKLLTDRSDAIDGGGSGDGASGKDLDQLKFTGGLGRKTEPKRRELQQSMRDVTRV